VTVGVVLGVARDDDPPHAPKAATATKEKNVTTNRIARHMLRPGSI
jgi:hypothetical protein